MYITVRKREGKKIVSEKKSTLALYNLFKKKETLVYAIKVNNIQKRGGVNLKGSCSPFPFLVIVTAVKFLHLQALPASKSIYIY